MKSIFMNDDQSLASEDIADFDFLVARMEALSIGEVLMSSCSSWQKLTACWHVDYQLVSGGGVFWTCTISI